MKKVILGLAIFFGSFTFAQQRGERPQHDLKVKKERHEKHMAKMKQNLKLTDNQVYQIKSLKEEVHKEQKDKREQLRKQKEAHRKAMHMKMDGKMRQILSPDQYEKWKKARKKHNRNKRTCTKGIKSCKKGKRSCGKKK